MWPEESKTRSTKLVSCVTRIVAFFSPIAQTFNRKCFKRNSALKELASVVFYPKAIMFRLNQAIDFQLMKYLKNTIRGMSWAV